MSTSEVSKSARLTSEALVTTMPPGALDPKLPPFRGDTGRPALPMVTAPGGVSVASGALTIPKLPPYRGD
jgi:hypothetical protein